MKNLKLILLVCLVGYSLKGNAQAMVVNDPVVSANIIKQTAQDIKNAAADAQAYLKQAEEFERLRKQAAKLKKVNNAIKTSKMVISIARNLTQSKNKVISIKNKISQIQTTKQKEDVLFEADLYLDEIFVLGDLYSTGISSNLLEMDDGKRTDILLKVYTHSVKLVRDLRVFERTVLSMIPR